MQDGQRLIVVVNGLKTATERAEEARKLFDWGFRSFDPRVLFQPGDTVGTRSVYGGAQSEVPLTCDRSRPRSSCRTARTERLIAKIVYNGPLAAPVAEGVEVGAAQDLARQRRWRSTLPLKTKALGRRSAASPSARSTRRSNSPRAGSARRLARN